MKKFFYIVAALLFTAYATSYAQTGKQNNAIKQSPVVLNGNWCETGYIQDLAVTKSPAQSQGKLKSIVAININTKEIKNNRLEVNAPGVHEGGSFIIDFKKKAITGNAFVTDIVDYEHAEEGGYFYELGYVSTPKKGSAADISLVIYHFNKNKMLIDKTIYSKTPTGQYDALEYMVSKTLIAGTYKGSDADGKLLQLIFTSAGDVKGLAGIKKYYVQTDFVVSGQNSTDAMCFDIQTNKQHCYIFEITGNTLKLYQEIKNARDYSVKKGELFYTLTRQ